MRARGRHAYRERAAVDGLDGQHEELQLRFDRLEAALCVDCL